MDKDGNVSRSFRAPKEDDWGLVKKRTESVLEKSGLHVGEFIYESLLENPEQKIRGSLIKTIERKYYKKELEAILDKQTSFHRELRNDALYKEATLELYPKNSAHRSNIKQRGFKYLFIEDIIFYQRPLKSQKHLIAHCQYEKRTYKNNGGETIEVSLQGAPKSHPSFQEFRIWQFISNLRFYDKEEIVEGQEVSITEKLLKSDSDFAELYHWLSHQREVDQNKTLKYFTQKKLIPKQKKDNPTIRWNFPEDKKYEMGEFKAQLLSRLEKVRNCQPDKFLTQKNELDLWHIIYSVTDKTEFEKALVTFAEKRELDSESFVENFKKFPPFKNDYASYSLKAIKKILPLMRRGKYWKAENLGPQTLQRIEKIVNGEADDKISIRARKLALHLNDTKSFQGLPTSLACYVAYNRHSENEENQKWQTPSDIDKYLKDFKQHSLRNPIVEQLITEALRVVRDIWKHYGQGQKDFFDEIHVELGREMKNPAIKRKKLSQKIQENENTNYRIKEVLRNLKENNIDAKPYSPSHQEILKIYEEGVYQSIENVEDEIEKIRKNNTPSSKDINRYRLWLEQGYISPYTGEVIPLSQLFSNQYEIEHIIPRSRFFDDSLANKVICESSVNALKDNKTALEFITNHGNEKVEFAGKTVEILSSDKYTEHCKRYFKRNRTKLKNLLSYDVPEGFINRQLNDSRFISKYVRNLLSNIVREEEEREAISKHILTIPGSITSQLKQDWGLNEKWNEVVTHRFERLNNLTGTTDFGFWDNKINAFRITVPKELSKGFNKKRIDHRHHTLDALVIAACTKDHVNYITSLNTERNNHSLVSKLRNTKKVLINGKERRIAKAYKLPWSSFPLDAKHQLETTVISFKQNLRVINKSSNKTWQWRNVNGEQKKKLIPQTKGDSWAIRKSMHKATVSAKVESVGKGKIKTTNRTPLGEIKGEKHVEKIYDARIREVIIPNHLNKYLDEKGKPNYEAAFSQSGIKQLNENIEVLNEGKPHAPIYKVPLFEVGSKFPVSEDAKSPKNQKYVEADKGTNLFFAVYWNEEKQKRNFETVPLHQVIVHQKQVASLPTEQRTSVPIKPELGLFLFSLSPNDLVYVPTEEEIENPHLVDLKNLSKDQTNRIYKMVSSTGNECHFIPHHISRLIMKYNAKQKVGEFGSLNKAEKAITGETIKEKCLKIQINSLGKLKTERIA